MCRSIIWAVWGWRAVAIEDCSLGRDATANCNCRCVPILSSVTHEKRDTVYVSFYNINGMGWRAVAIEDCSLGRDATANCNCRCVQILSSVTHEKRDTKRYLFFRGGRGWIRTTESGAGRFTVCSLWPLGNPSIIVVEHFIFKIGLSPKREVPKSAGAGDGSWTRNLLITNQLLCHWATPAGKWCLEAESNHRHGDFQSPALPTELSRLKLATWKGLEPSTSSVTG